MSPAPRTTGAMRRARAALGGALALAATAAVAVGCGLGEGESSEGEATLTVTRDYGSVELIGASTEDPSTSDTVLRFLDREAEIETRYGGRFVQSIDGLSGAKGARSTDWFFYVNGSESPVGAADVELAAGDRIWWDHHDWTDVMRVPAVVGSWPAPFSTAEPAEVLCMRSEREACEAVEATIEDSGGSAVESGSGDPDRPGELHAPLVLVGPWETVRKSSRAAILEQAPRRSGVFAAFERAGSAWELATYDQALAERERLGAGTGIVAAVEGSADAPVWIVTGTDARGVSAATRLLDGPALENRFAVAAPADGEALPLPVP